MDVMLKHTDKDDHDDDDKDHEDGADHHNGGRLMTGTQEEETSRPASVR